MKDVKVTEVFPYEAPCVRCGKPIPSPLGEEMTAFPTSAGFLHLRCVTVSFVLEAGVSFGSDETKARWVNSFKEAGN